MSSDIERGPRRPPREVVLVFDGANQGDPDILVSILLTKPGNPQSGVEGVFWGDPNDLGDHQNGPPPDGVHAIQAGQARPDTDLVPPSCYWTGTEWICC